MFKKIKQAAGELQMKNSHKILIKGERNPPVFVSI